MHVHTCTEIHTDRYYVCICPSPCGAMPHHYWVHDISLFPEGRWTPHQRSIILHGPVLFMPPLALPRYISIYIYILCHMVLNTAKRGGEHTQREREIDERRSPALDLRAGSFLGIPALFCGAAPYHRMISSFPFCCGWRCAVSLVHRGGVCINIYGCCVGWCAAHTHKPKRQPLFFSFPPVWCVPSFLPTPTLTMHMSLYCAPLILFGAPLLPAYDIQGAA